MEIRDFFVFLRHHFPFERGRSAVDFTSLQGQIQFSARIADDEFLGSLRPKSQAKSLLRMNCTWPTDWPPTLSPTRSRSFSRLLMPRSFAGYKDIVILAERRSEIDKLGGIKLTPVIPNTALARMPGELAPIVSPSLFALW